MFVTGGSPRRAGHRRAKYARALLAVLLAATASPCARAARIVVATLDDVSAVQCTLRDAIAAAADNAATGACPAGEAGGVAEDEIVFDEALFAGGAHATLSLSSPLPALKGRIAISGPGAETFAIRRADDAPFFRILTVEGDRTRLSDLSLVNGVVINDVGGGIYAFGDLELVRCTVAHNQAIRSSKRFTDVRERKPSGGGIHIGNDSSLSVIDSRIEDNRTVASEQYPQDDDGGGGIYTNGVLTLTRSVVSGNRSGAQGGGISGSAMTIEDSEIAFNRGSSGGGIFAGSSAALAIRTSAIHDNIASSEGGGLIAYGEDIQLERLSVYANRAGASGGGILVRTREEHQFRLVNSTLHGNHSDMGGGGIGLDSQSSFDRLYLIHNSITGNSASVGGGLDLFGLTGLNQNGLTLAANLIAANNAGASPDVDAGINGSAATNLIGNSAGAVQGSSWPPQPITESQGYILNVDARLGPLLDDGIQRVQSVLPDSRAINAANCYQVSVDQSGGPRPLDSRCEIGAHEFRGAQEQSLRFESPTARVLGAAPFQVNVAATRPLGTDVSSQVQLASLTTDVCAASNRTVTLHAAGLCTLEASLPAGSGGAGLPRLAVARSFRVVDAPTKTAQAIEFPALPDRVLSDPPLGLNASASSGLPIAYAAQGSCTISSDTIVAHATGACTVTASQDGDADYAAAVPVSRSFTVHPDGETPPIVVTTLEDVSDTRCTLREAIRAANDNVASGWCSGGDPNPLVTDVIRFDPRLFDGGPKRIELATALPTLGGRVQLIGPGADLLDVHRNGDAAFRILRVPSGAEVLVQGLTLSGGLEGGVSRPDGSSDAGFGGGIHNQGRLVLRRCVVRDNRARGGFLSSGTRPTTGVFLPGGGGGIFNDRSGDLLLEESTVSGNEVTIGEGGGIHNRRTLTLRDSLIAGNRAGGIVSRPPSAVLLFGGEGGGLYSEAGATLENTTVADNVSESHGGGIFATETLRLRHATVTGNKAYWLDYGVPVAGGGVFAFSGVDVANSVIAGNWVEIGTQIDLAGTPNASGANLLTGNPGLAGLADNGGATRTSLPLAGSPLLDAAPCLDDLARDARGQPRPGANSTDARCDIGAVEVQRGGALAQTIDFPSIGARPFGSFPLEANASSGLAVVFAAEPPEVCTVTGRMLTTVALGSCTVTASQPGNAEFAAAAPVTQTFSIERAAQTIAFDPLPDRVFGDAPFVVRALASSVLPVDYAAQGACSIAGETVTLTTAGECTITARQDGDAYTLPAEPVSRRFRILQATQTIAFDALPDRTFGDAPFALAASASSGLPVAYAADGSCTVASGTVTLTAPGDCAITASQPGDADIAAAEPVSRAFHVYADTDAEPIVVTTLEDVSDTHCTLRDAILAANDNAPHGRCGAGNANPLATDRIRFDPALDDGTPKELRLASALPALSGRVELAGPDGGRLTLLRAADAPFRILDVDAGAVAEVSDLGFTGGLEGGVDASDGTTTPGIGGGLRNGGDLTLRRCVVSGNRTVHGTEPRPNAPALHHFSSGGGLYNGAGARLTIEDSTIRDNEASLGRGGGVYSLGSLTLRNSLITGNQAKGEMVWHPNAPRTLGGGHGGGIYSTGPTRLENVGLANNQSSNEGGGIASTSDLTLAHVTAVGNRIERLGFGSEQPAGGGIHARGRFALANSVVAGNIGTRDTDDDLGGAPAEATGTNQIGGDPMLTALADNGGPTQTLRPEWGSPLIDAAECLTEVAQDARGVARPSGIGCDVGAVEFRQHRLDVEVGSGGTVSALPSPAPLDGGIVDCRDATCSAVYDGEADSIVTLSALPSPGHFLVGWDGDCSGSELAVEVELDANRRCAANFAPITFTVSANAGLHGKVAPATQTVPLDSVAVVTVTPDTGYHVAEVTGCGGSLDGDRYTTAAITADCTIEASFAVDTFTVHASTDGNGILTPSTQTADYGAQASVAVTPNSDYRLDVIDGCGGSLDGEVYTTAPVSADCVISARFTPDVYTVGGRVEGVLGPGLLLQLNGGGDLPIAADGEFVFAAPVLNRGTYAVTVRLAPTSPEQVCSVANGSGTIAGADVTDVVVTCRALQPSLSVRVSDGRDFARYGRLLNYLVTVTNSGDGDATGLRVGGELPPQLDPAYTRWICLDGGGGAHCTDGGDGALDDAGVAIPAGRSLTWLVTAPVRLDAGGATIDYRVGVADDAAQSTDSDTLVVLRSGFDVPYGDGAEGEPPAPARACTPSPGARIDASGEPAAMHALVVPPPGGTLIDTLLRGGSDVTGGFRVERLNDATSPRLRLVVIDADGRERAGAWARTASGTRIALGVAAGDGGRGVLLLEGTHPLLQMPLSGSPDLPVFRCD